MRKKLFLLPILMTALAACGGKTSSDSEPNSSVNSTPTSNPSVGTSSISQGNSSPASVTIPDGYTTIAEARGFAMAQASGVYSDKGYRVKGTVTGIMGRSYHIQSGTEAIYVYNNTQAPDFIAAPSGLAVGVVVEVFGPVTQYLGLVQISSAKVVMTQTVLSETPEVIVPLEINSWDEVVAGMSSRLVRINDLRYVSGVNVVGTSKRDIKFSLNGTSVNLAVDKTNDDIEEAAIKAKLESFDTTTPITYNGNIGWNDAPNMMICTAADLSV